MKLLEVAVLRIGFEAGQRLRNRVHRGLAVALRLLQIGEIAALDPLVVGVVCCHGPRLLSEVTVHAGLGALT